MKRGGSAALGAWLAAAGFLLSGGPAVAAQSSPVLNIPAGPLAEALLQLSQQAGIELLFDRDAAVGRRAPSVQGRFPPEIALQRLLQDSGFVVRRSASGLFVVERPAPAPLARQDVTVPEILVIGRRSQNADIRRLESDIQPYRVATGSQILQADRDNLDGYFASRVPSNTTTIRPSLDLKGATNSQIDLRGLGASSTLVLIDGRRMPGVPGQFDGFLQPDLNAVPLHAIERVEVLTGAAGGIYGYDAQGGVINVVLARGLTGAELDVTGGVAARGDARQVSLEGRIGSSLNGGRTDVMLVGSASWAEPLLNGQRDFVMRYLGLDAARVLPLGRVVQTSSVSVTNLTGAPLVFKPAYGGATLDAKSTFLPSGSSGDPTEVVRLLTQNAGRSDAQLSPQVAASQIASTPNTAAILGNVRHRFDSGLEAYLDAVVLRNRGEYRWRKENAYIVLPPGSALNPFTTPIGVRYPVEAAAGERTTGYDSTRFTVGLVAPLPHDWRATAEAAVGSARYDFVERYVAYGFPTGQSLPPTQSPFGDWATFQASLVPALTTYLQAWTINNCFQDLSLRLAGPVFQTAQGPATLTLLAERMVESVPSYESRTMMGGTTPSSQTVAPWRTVTTSLYGEFRSPVFGREAPLPALRNLEVQLAVRGDSQADVFSKSTLGPSVRIHGRFTDASFTAGAKVSPTSWLTLRGSYATSASPPPVRNLIDGASTTSVIDPKRGRSRYATPWMSGGSKDPKSALVSTGSVGVILAPFGRDGPRLAVDYSRIRKTRELFSTDPSVYLLYEELWPSRVARGPLTEADRALGYTAGPILALDDRDNYSRSKYDMIDARLDGRWPLAKGSLRLYGDGTYYLTQRSITPVDPGVNLIGYRLYPLAWRANLGADWIVGPVTVGANLQYFGGYRLSSTPKDDPAAKALDAAIQGSDRIASQAYVDLHLSWRDRLPLPGSTRDIQIDLGIVNVFDKAPPRQTGTIDGYSYTGPPSPSYSRYGDPRLRRFLLTVSTRL